MFDPHRTRRSDSRYFTRKGQVLQASRVNTNPVIDQRLVPIYKNYILKNGLIKNPPPPLPPPSPSPSTIHPIGIAITYDENLAPPVYYPFASMTVKTEQTFTIEEPISSPKALLLFQQKTNGSFYFLVATLSSSWSYPIFDNVKCYYTFISITDPSLFLVAKKSLYHTSGSIENIFLTYNRDDEQPGVSNQEISFNALNIEL